VVNTCSFIESAQKESVTRFWRWPNTRSSAREEMIVAGCLVERYRNQILEQVPEVGCGGRPRGKWKELSKPSKAT